MSARTQRPGTALVLLAVVLVAGLVAVTACLTMTLGYFDRAHPVGFIALTALAWLIFGCAALVIRRVPLRAALVIIIAGSVLVGGAALAGPPTTSTDSARYAWDGIVQDAGISPYEYVPAADALAPLRPSWLFSPAIANADGTRRCADPRMQTVASVPSHTVICTVINRPTVHTIYPAAGELYFAAVRFFVPTEVRYWPLQLTGLLLSLGITISLILAMRRRGLDPRTAALFAFCPLVASEAINNAHIDVLGTLLVVVASLLVSRGLRFRGGIALGAAIAVKLVPVIAAPALLRKQPVRVIAASIVTFLVLYIPYLIASGVAVIGFLPGYLNEEGYSDGGRFTLLSIFFNSDVALPIAVVLLLILVVIVWCTTNPQKPWLGQLVMIGTVLLIASPRYPWYALLLIPFIALSGRWEWFTVPLALLLRQYMTGHTEFQISLSVAVILIVVMALYRSRATGVLRASGRPRSRRLGSGRLRRSR